MQVRIFVIRLIPAWMACYLSTKITTTLSLMGWPWSRRVSLAVDALDEKSENRL